MLMPIAVSQKMSELARKIGYETKFIRIPEKLRHQEGIELYTFLNLPTKTGEIISLITEKAYKEDAIISQDKAFVAEEIFEILDKSEKLEVERCNEVTIGCDPELMVINKNTGAIVDAHKIFRKWSQVGSDGLLLELRPSPSTSAEDVTDRLFYHIQQARTILNKGLTLTGNRFSGELCSIIARSHYCPPGLGRQLGQNAGFHIHFGIPQKILNYRQPYILRNIASLLDYYVGIPAILIEGEHDNIRRSQVHIAYGKPGDWRRGSGNLTMEYRVPGGALMKTPNTVWGILAISKMVMTDVLYRLQLLSNDFEDEDALSDYTLVRSLYPSVPDGNEVFSIICSPSIDPAKAVINNVYRDYENMIYFANEKQAITTFLKTVSNPLVIPDTVEDNWRKFYEQKNKRQMGIYKKPETKSSFFRRSAVLEKSSS